MFTTTKKKNLHNIPTKHKLKKKKKQKKKKKKKKKRTTWIT